MHLLLMHVIPEPNQPNPLIPCLSQGQDPHTMTPSLIKALMLAVAAACMLVPHTLAADASPFNGTECVWASSLAACTVSKGTRVADGVNTLTWTWWLWAACLLHACCTLAVLGHACKGERMHVTCEHRQHYCT